MDRSIKQLLDEGRIPGQNGRECSICEAAALMSF